MIEPRRAIMDQAVLELGSYARERIFPFPILLLDLSLTRASARIVTEDLFTTSWSVDLDLAAFSGATAVVEHILEASPVERPRSLIMAFPGPVLGHRARYTNTDWVVDCAEIQRRFRFANGILLNDQEAAAFSIPDLGVNETIHIGSKTLPSGSGVELLVSLRHGLGVSSLKRLEGRFYALPSEAGHINVGPSSSEEAAILADMLAAGQRPNAEHIFYKPGLALVHETRTRLHGLRISEPHDARAVASRALADAESEEAASVRLFARLFASYVGDVALATFATGGATISGGILPLLGPFFQHPGVRHAFEAKTPMMELMRKTSFRLALVEDATLRGMTVLAQSPEFFGVDLDGRCWDQIP
jgi:glucokinase